MSGRNYTTAFAARMPWRLRVLRRVWAARALATLAWKTRRPNLVMWAWDIRRIHVAERNYIRDLERAAFLGPDHLE